MRRSFFKRKYRDFEIEPDQIFMDDLNVSDLNQQQFEGVIEKPISQKTLLFLGGFIILIFGVFFGRLIIVQLAQGDSFLKRSENNRLKRTPLFAERGVIYDRNNNEIAWNTNAGEEVQFSYRAYTERSGHGHLLGYVNYPQTDSSGNYWRTDISGQTGIEKKYNQELAGTNGSKLIETDAFGEGISNNIISMPENGTNILTTVDTYIQHYLYEAIKIQAEEAGFQGGAASVMDVHTGELLAFTSYPEFDPYTLAEGDDVEKIQEFFNDPRKPFLNRVLSGLYSPGSTVKPFLGIGALNEGLINENTKILSTGRIEVPNRFNPDEPSIFRDWRPEGHGLTDIRHAIADSVNTFFYAIGGGWKRQDGLGISRIEEYIEDFGIAQKTGIDFGSEATGTIPNPEWKDRVFDDGTWRLGDTYITSIGQFGFQVTPIQMTRATAALANNGKLLQPLLVRDDAVIENIKHDINQEDYELIRLAMRDTVTKGTAGIINIPEVKMAAKTGTAQVGVDNEFYNSWIIGFFPYDDPLYAFSLVMERG
ncbi:MAG: penicillin-binding protein 2, partial [Candidatus Paceibacteria bacterium]